MLGGGGGGGGWRWKDNGGGSGAGGVGVGWSKRRGWWWLPRLMSKSQELLLLELWVMLSMPSNQASERAR